MKKSTINKLLTASFALAFACATAAVAVPVVANANVTPITVDAVTGFTMKGASVRLHDESGVRFSATLTETDYQGLVAQYGEENLSFGTFIMPKDYVEGTITKDSFFGESSVYTWNGKTEAQGAEATDTKIMQMESQIYFDDVEFNAYRVNGSIAPVLPKNYARDFVGYCYVAAKTATGVEYTLATVENAVNERSLVYVAQLAQDVYETESEEYAATQKIINDYIASCGETPTVMYTVNKYYNDGKATETTTANANLNAKIDLSTSAERFYTVDTTQGKTSGYALIGDKLVLDVYYKTTVSLENPASWISDERSTITYDATKDVYTLTHNNATSAWHDLYISKQVVNYCLDNNIATLKAFLGCEGKAMTITAPATRTSGTGAAEAHFAITSSLRDTDLCVTFQFTSNADNVPYTVKFATEKVGTASDPSTWLKDARSEISYDATTGFYTLTHTQEIAGGHDLYVDKTAVNAWLDAGVQYVEAVLECSGKSFYRTLPNTAGDSNVMAVPLTLTRDTDVHIYFTFQNAQTGAHTNTTNDDFKVSFTVVDAFDEKDQSTWLYFTRAGKYVTYDGYAWTLNIPSANYGGYHLKFTDTAFAYLKTKGTTISNSYITISSGSYHFAGKDANASGWVNNITLAKQLSLYVSAPSLKLGIVFPNGTAYSSDRDNLSIDPATGYIVAKGIATGNHTFKISAAQITEWMNAGVTALDVTLFNKEKGVQFNFNGDDGLTGESNGVDGRSYGRLTLTEAHKTNGVTLTYYFYGAEHQIILEKIYDSTVTDKSSWLSDSNGAVSYNEVTGTWYDVAKTSGGHTITLSAEAVDALRSQGATKVTFTVKASNHTFQFTNPSLQVAWSPVSATVDIPATAGTAVTVTFYYGSNAVVNGMSMCEISISTNA